MKKDSQITPTPKGMGLSTPRSGSGSVAVPNAQLSLRHNCGIPVIVNASRIPKHACAGRSVPLRFLLTTRCAAIGLMVAGVYALNTRNGSDRGKHQSTSMCCKEEKHTTRLLAYNGGVSRPPRVPGCVGL